MNVNMPNGYVADSGTYALVGAASVLGGMARMTIAGTVICLEACGNMAYLLPLMVTFTGARYVGNAFGSPMYDMQITVKELPLLEASLHNLGLLNYQSMSEIMTNPVVTLQEVDKVSRVMHVLTTTSHNGFPVINEQGQLRGIILRRTLCSLLTFKAYSVPTGQPNKDNKIEIIAASTVAFDTLERTYPNFPDVSSIKLTEVETGYWLDVRPYMDHAPYMVSQETTLSRCYNMFRTMGLRHLPIVDGELKVIGIVTRANFTEHNLHHIWEHEGEEMIKSMNVEASEPTFVAVADKNLGRTSSMAGNSLDRHENQRRASVDSNGERQRSNTALTTGSEPDEELVRAKAEADDDDEPRTILKKTLSPR